MKCARDQRTPSAPSSAMPPSHSVAQPAMDERQRMIGDRVRLSSPSGPGIP